MSVVEQWEKVAVEPAGPTDAVGGVQPRLVAQPASTEDVSTVMRAATAAGLAVVARGAGTTIGWGPPPTRVDVVIDTGGLAGVVEHVAGDLVVKVGAGTRLADLQASLTGSGQRLALDGDLGPATIGGLVAHGLAGPSRLAYGTLRDLLIGATFVLADGVVAHSGGKVVKNVAGYDLGKLLHGSWGTLAVLTEATLRLHPLPQARRWVTTEASGPAEVGSFTQAVVHSQLVPAAWEIDRPPGAPAVVAALLEGRRATIDVRAGAVATLLGSAATVSDTPPPWWGRRPPASQTVRHPTPSTGVRHADNADTRTLRDPTPPAGAQRTENATPYETMRDPTPRAGVQRAKNAAVLLRLTTEVAGLPHLLSAIDRASAATGLAVHLRGSAGVGSLLAAVTPTDSGPTTPTGLTSPTGPTSPTRPTSPAAIAPAAVADLVDRLRQQAGGWGGTVVVLDGPSEVMSTVDTWGPIPALDLMRRVKDRFDPDRLLFPGRFVGGI